MPQSRKLIRDKVRELLLGNTTAGTNVYVNRETSLWTSELPAILISNGEETAVPRDLRATQHRRTLNLVIEVKVEANDTVDDDLDTIAGEIETILLANPTLDATCISQTYKSATLELDSDSEIEKGVLTLTFEVQYLK